MQGQLVDASLLESVSLVVWVRPIVADVSMMLLLSRMHSLTVVHTSPSQYRFRQGGGWGCHKVNRRH